LASDGGKVVEDATLNIQAYVPPGWIVRQIEEDGEHRMVISRELLEGFPRFRMGLTVRSVNTLRRQAKAAPSEMALGLCELNQKNGSAITPCHTSSSGQDLVVEWKVLFPGEGADTPAVAWKKILANDTADTLLWATFQYPQAEATQGESVAARVMPSVQRTH
jgi:hypothetical protein